MPMLDATYLNNNYVGRNINVICPNGFHDAAANHCAHLVGHILGISHGYTCQDDRGGPPPGATLRVHEMFTTCLTVGDWEQRTALPSPCLVFVTTARGVNLRTKHFPNIRRKHVGIYLNGSVYNYHNQQDQVGTRTSAQFRNLYHGHTNYAYYGTLPPHYWIVA